LSPQVLKIARSYPNPFNPLTTIEFELTRPADVRVAVYDVLGRMVAILTGGRYAAGVHRVEWDAEEYSSGAYFSRVEANGEVRVLKVLLTK
jgi:isopenicillin N synthase-like dioxygenase